LDYRQKTQGDEPNRYYSGRSVFCAARNDEVSDGIRKKHSKKLQQWRDVFLDIQSAL
jgi:hypothetical protein